MTVVTDSTASVPPELLDEVDVVVVPLQVIIDGAPYREGVDLSREELVDALRAGAAVTTSQPGPETFARTYARVVSGGAREIVSVHLSGDLSGTVTSAQTAAQTSGIPVRVVDSRTVGMGLGLAVLAAARAAASGADSTAVARAAETTASTSSVLFAVDTLEFLRRGGRLGPVAAALGTVLGTRPVLGVRGGRIEVVEKVRSSGRARDRIVELTSAEAARRPRVDLAVHHLGGAETAHQVAERLRAACGTGLREIHVQEVSAVVGAHVGPGVIAVVLADA